MIRLALLGDPVQHSRSPAIHAAALGAAGLDGEYSARRVDAAGMAQAAEELRRGELDGANITMPHKRLAAGLSDDLRPNARRAGSVNTWLVEDGRLLGYSTDGRGIRFAWTAGALPEEGPVLVLGNGGAAAAALLELEDRPLFLSARDTERSRLLLEQLSVRAELVEWGAPVPDAVVVNATPIGMGGEPLPVGVVAAASGLLDMAYGTAATPAIRTAAELALPHADGLDMLIGQAMASFFLWTGVAPNEAAMRAAAL